jgi:hypothetical protein
MNVPGFPDKAMSGGPGRLGPGGAASVMIFDVAHTMVDMDLLDRFFVEDADALQWLRDFLCDPIMDRTIERLAALTGPDVDEEEELPEDIYSRAELMQGPTFDDT